MQQLLYNKYTTMVDGLTFMTVCCRITQNTVVMKEKHRQKLFRLVKDDNLPKLKSYVKKRSLNVAAVREDVSDNTLLHLACALGHDVVAMLVSS